MSELKHCPCCKGEAKLLKTGHAPRVYCTECRLNTGGCETEEEAVEKWNRRADDAD